MGQKRSSYRILVGRPKGRRPLERPRRTWENNIKMDLRDIDWGDMHRTHLAHDRDQ
jgi:hypothetical protein